MRDRVGAGELDQVILTAPDRLARNYVHQMVLIEELESHGCQVEFLDRPMSQDPHDQLLLQIRGAVAEYERTLIAERIRRGNCPNIGGRITALDDPAVWLSGEILTGPETPPSADQRSAGRVIREMFAFYLQEEISLLVSQPFARFGDPGAKGAVYWNVATVRAMLKNPAYTGQVYTGRTHPARAKVRRSAVCPAGKLGQSSLPAPTSDRILVAYIPAIIPQEVFEQVKAKLAHNQSFALRNNTAHQYLLRALVTCGVCHLSCTGRQLARGYQYYVCTGKSS